MKVPLRSSLYACCSCSCVFMTIGPYHATGSSIGFPETSRNLIPASPACTVTSSPFSNSTSDRFPASADDAVAIGPTLSVRTSTGGDASDQQGVLTEQIGIDATIREKTGNRSLVLFDSGDEVVVQAGDEGIRFLLVSGKPIEEPVAWYGPIVMNTNEQLQQAISELRSGTFIKER